MKLKKVLNELSNQSWNESHLQDLINKAKNLSSEYFIEKYNSDIKTMPRKFARIFFNNVDETLQIKLLDYRNFKDL